MSEETDQIANILDDKYAPADLQKIVDNLPQLDMEQQEIFWSFYKAMTTYSTAPLASGRDPLTR